MHDKEIRFTNTFTSFLRSIPKSDLERSKHVDANKFILEFESTESGLTPILSTTNKYTAETRDSYLLFIEAFFKIEFNLGIIPYDEITKLIYRELPEEKLTSLSELLTELYKDTLHLQSKYSQNKSHEDNKLREYEKILRHISLALTQKHEMGNIRSKEIAELKMANQNLRADYNDLQEKIQSQYNKMLTQFIGIMGIFSAILMGAFGAIQAFSNLFSNAHKLDLGIILIISSIGASGVILILYFLLNGVTKLTGNEFSGSSEDKSTLIEKHPSLMISHGILILIAFIGASLELSNVRIKFAWQGLWWLIPLFWFIYLLIALSTKKIFPSIQK